MAFRVQPYLLAIQRISMPQAKASQRQRNNDKDAEQFDCSYCGSYTANNLLKIVIKYRKLTSKCRYRNKNHEKTGEKILTDYNSRNRVRPGNIHIIWYIFLCHIFLHIFSLNATQSHYCCSFNIFMYTEARVRNSQCQEPK